MSQRLTEVSAKLSGLAAPAILDAVANRFTHEAHLDGLVTPTPGRVLFGPAATIRYIPARQDLRDAARHSFATKFYEAVGDEPAGKVLVLSSGGHTRTSLGGGTKLSRLQNHRLAGVVADGRLRDFHEFEAYDFTAYCRGDTARAGDGSVMPFEANVPVSIGGVTVAPGDWVYVDRHGGVVIPGGSADEILDEARRLETADQEWIARIRKEDPGRVLKEGSGEK